MPSAGLAASEFPVYKKLSQPYHPRIHRKAHVVQQLREPWRSMNLPPTRTRTSLLSGLVPGRGDGTGSKTIGAIVPWSARRSGTEKRLTIWAHLCDKLTITICTLVGKVRRLSAICQINLSHTRLKFKVGHPERVLTLLRLLISYRLILLLQTYRTARAVAR